MVNHGCKLCNYSTEKKCNYNRHMESSKHFRRAKQFEELQKKRAKTPVKPPKIDQKFDCRYCGTVFKYLKGLNRHINKCSRRMELLIKYEELTKDYQKMKETITELKKSKEELAEDKKLITDKYETLIEKYEIKRDELEETLIENAKTKTNPNMFSFIEDNFLETKYLDEIRECDVPKLKAFNSVLEQEQGEMEMCNILQHHSMHKTLKDYIGDILKKIYHRKDKSRQKFFVTDCSRLSYVIRDIVDNELSWRRDNGGVILSKRIILPILSYIRELLSEHMSDYLGYVLDEFPDDKLESVNRIQRLTHIITAIDDGKLSKNILKYLSHYFQLDKTIVENNKPKMIKKKGSKKSSKKSKKGRKPKKGIKIET